MEPRRTLPSRGVIAITVLALLVALVHGCCAEFVHIRDISKLCGKRNSVPFVVGGAAASLLLRRKAGDYNGPCHVVQRVETDPGHIRNGARLYTKVISIGVQENRDGQGCYHSLTIEEADGFRSEMCGALANLETDEFVSKRNLITITWDMNVTTDPELSRQSYELSSFKVVITAFEDLDRKTNECPASRNNDHPETVIAWHKCTNARCIDARLRCNGFNNCGDPEGSDEINCLAQEDNISLLSIILGVVFGGVSLFALIAFSLYKMGDSEETSEAQAKNRTEQS